MNSHSASLLAATLLLLVPGAALAQNIYRCSQGGEVIYTDRPCPRGQAELLLHEADDGEVIDRYLRLGQDDLAAKYASDHHLEKLYQQRLDAFHAAQEEKSRRDEQADQDRRQREEAVRAESEREEQEAGELEREHLVQENAALRGENAALQGALAQPAYIPVPVYAAQPPAGRPWRGGHADRHPGRDQPRSDVDARPDRPPPVSDNPRFHPCTQLAGGRSSC